ncbi:hypothetical protein C900_02326 [Fulvivirga imtechensis AK7]|uniref:Lipoprotein n=1 Tax=Fulvivirga imtechensis AK7 TaxID=1237149 RepID=L8JS27_9BACT|nr:hypothetical protein [Fulvivirga imtechensis]ELR71741.1 hypothetical protein C900_02326 [Fulvivirga imtechensis AK7]
MKNYVYCLMLMAVLGGLASCSTEPEQVEPDKNLLSSLTGYFESKGITVNRHADRIEIDESTINDYAQVIKDIEWLYRENGYETIDLSGLKKEARARSYASESSTCKASWWFVYFNTGGSGVMVCSDCNGGVYQCQWTWLT